MPTRVRSHPVPAHGTRPKNRLLAGLPAEDFERVSRHLRTVPLAFKQILHPRGRPIREVFFPNGGMASVTVVMNDGRMVEIATIGDEGVVGLNVLFGAASMSDETMLQVPVPETTAEVMSVQAFRAELDRGGAFYDYIRRYARAMMALTMHSTACMALHTVQERCARWLLMTHDGVRQDRFQLSHEFLASMLGQLGPL